MFHTASNVFFILLSVLFFNRYPFKCLFCVIATNRYFNFFLIITVCLCNSNKIRVYIGRNSQTFKPLRQPLGYQRLGDAIRIQRLLQGGELQLLQGRLGRGLAGLAGPGGARSEACPGSDGPRTPTAWNCRPCSPGQRGRRPRRQRSVCAENGGNGGGRQDGTLPLGPPAPPAACFLAGSLLQEPLEGCLRVQFQAQGSFSSRTSR